MAALASTPTPLQFIQHERFTTRQHGYRLWDLSLSVSGNIAVSGRHDNGRTFIDLYFGRNSVSRDKLKLFYSKEFEKYSDDWRYVSFAEENGSKVVTGIKDKIEDILDTKNECKVLRSCRVNGRIRCLAVREGEIFIGLWGSQTVIIFNNDLIEKKKIKLKGIKKNDYPCDLQVIKDTVFVCTGYGKAYAMSESDGSTITQYTDTTGKYSNAYSITVSERLGLVAVVWGNVWGGDRIIVYSLNGSEPFLFFDAGPDVLRIRISDKDRTIMAGNRDTGEIKIYDLEYKKTVEDEEDELQKMKNQPEEQEETLTHQLEQTKQSPVSSREKRKILTGELDQTKTESTKTAGRLAEKLTQTKQPLDSSRKKIKTLTGDLDQTKTESNETIQRLAEELTQTKQSLDSSRKEIKTLTGDLDQTKTESNETIQRLTDELAQTKQSFDSSREKIKTLTGDLDQTKAESNETIQRLTDELAQTKQSFDSSREKIKTLTEDLDQTKAESNETIQRLTDELAQTKQSFDSSREKIKTLTEDLDQTKAESNETIQRLTDELAQTKQSFDSSREKIKTLTENLDQTKEESNETIQRLTDELAQAKQSFDSSREKIKPFTGDLDQAKMESNETIQRLTDELAQAKQSFYSSREKIKTLTGDLDQTKTESNETIQRLAEELTQTKQSLDSSRKKIKTLTGDLDRTKTDSNETIQRLTDELAQAKQSFDSSREKTKTCTVELDQTRTESAETLERLTKQLVGSTKEIETLTKELNQTNQSLAVSREEAIKQIGIFRDQLEQTRNSKKEIEALADELKQTRKESTTKMQSLTEELIETKQSLDTNKAETAKMINALNEQLEQSTCSSKSVKTSNTLTEELTKTKQSMDFIRSESSRKIEKLTLELNSNIKEKEALYRVLEKTKEDRNLTITELKRYHLYLAEESKALKEVLDQTKQAMAELQKGPVLEKPLDDLEETRDGDMESLAAEFERLTVAITEHLTLDHCLKLAGLLNVPASECDMVRRLSLVETPGIKFLDVLKKRRVINMFDVSNLQKGLAMLHLEKVNHDLVRPYQESIDDEQYELHKVEEMFLWEDINASVKDDADRHQIRKTQTSPDDDSESGEAAQLGGKGSWPEARVEDGGFRFAGRLHQLYTEQNVGKEGRTIQFASLSLRIPPDAIDEIHVIAISVMYEYPFPLDREVDTARMTPLIKLEPLGLTFKKPVQLSIPHFALIPELANHDVIIYSGQMSKTPSDSVQWTLQRSLPRQLKEKSVTIDITCLSYFSASLVSPNTAPPLFIVRALPVVDGVRNADDDITLTVCFCSDNDSEYNMLLSENKKKLPLDQYSTLQLHRQSERDEDSTGLCVSVSSVSNSYVPDTELAVKKIAVSHLFAASRVSHQLKLRKNRQTGNDLIDLILTFTQSETKLTEIFMKYPIKDLMISQESEDFLDSLPPDLTLYQNLESKLASMLETLHCRQLATYFDLSPAEAERVENHPISGEMLMKILAEREKIMPGKMIGLFQSLKCCHLDKLARLVSEYIEEYSKQTLTEEESMMKNSNGITKVVPTSQHQSKRQQAMAVSSKSHQSVQTILSSSCITCNSHVRTLTNEGHAEQVVVEALDISKNRVHLARKVLQCIADERVILPKKDIFLYKEQYIDENGGDVILREADVHMLIPSGAVSKGGIVSITMMTSQDAAVPSVGRTVQLTPVVKCGQAGLTLKEPITIRIPHCALETEGIEFSDMHLGFADTGKEIQWRKRRQNEPPPSLSKDYFEVFVTKFCAVSLYSAVDQKKPVSKRLRLLPVIRRVTNPTDDLIVTVWIYNDDETEHMRLLHEEITLGSTIQLHECKRFLLKLSDKEVHIRSESQKISPYSNANKKRFLSTTLWQNARNSAEFHFQNNDGISDISFTLKLYTKQFFGFSPKDLQIDLRVTLPELLEQPQESTRAVIKMQKPHPSMEKSFQKLISKLSAELVRDSCLEIAGIFGLSSSIRGALQESSEPGDVLFDKLVHEQLVSAASVSALDVALTRTGNEHLADHVKEYRRRNATFSTTVFTLL